MYNDCMFCNRPLGANEVLETLPVGRRLAFDSAKGRLWVVCRRCERWNLAPLDERWEAVEACERMFQETRLRVSSENIGLARHSEGLDLVRIGSPLRGEFAAWRYGDQFGRRRRKAFIYGAAGAAVFGTIVVGGMATGILSGAVLGQSGNFVNMWMNGRTRMKVRTPDGRLLKLKNPHILKARIQQVGEGWAVTFKKGRKVEVFEGPEAERVAGLLMTRLNHAGGSKRRVQDAVGQIERHGHPERFLDATVRQLGRGQLGGGKGIISKIEAGTKLALEMALHEERERRALDGQLRGLEIIWREEEEIAAIADDLLLPEGARDRIEVFRADDDPAR
ncbi:MAG TPA: hypothetical protein VGA70_10880 [Longimicrobiales bacterium]|jgi:hypothetical protein